MVAKLQRDRNAQLHLLIWTLVEVRATSASVGMPLARTGLTAMIGEIDLDWDFVCGAISYATQHGPSDCGELAIGRCRDQVKGNRDGPDERHHVLVPRYRRRSGTVEQPGARTAQQR